MNRLLSFLVVVFLLFQSCQNESKLEKEIAKVDVEINVERFDKLFAQSSAENLPNLKRDYPFMFSKRYPDSVWIARINDTWQQQLFKQVDSVYQDFSEVEDELVRFYRHIKYYNPNFRAPRIFTVINDVDYRSKTIVTDSIALIAIDTYLGSEHEFYSNIQKYLKQNFVSSQIVSDLATQYAQKQIFQPKRKSLLDEMVYFGKILYFKDVMIPFKTDEDKIGYTSDQLNWAQANEVNIWEYLVERELLFETDPKLNVRFINPAPFTKFNLELDSESPGRIGQYIGWQIVRSFMENNEVSINDMLLMDADELFNKSKFKPRK